MRANRLFLALVLGLVVLLSACTQSPQASPGGLSTLDFGTPQGDGAFSVAAASARHVYVAGITSGELHGENDGSQDGFLRRYDSHGDLVWGRQIHSRFTDFANDVAADPGGENAYVAGGTEGSLAGTRGGFDAYVRRYDETGREVWTRQFGTAEGDFASSVDAAGDGYVYVAGGTFGDLARTNRGENDAYVRKYRPDGAVVWTRQFGTPGAELADEVAVGSGGQVYLAGTTTGSLDGSTPAGQDVYVRRYSAGGDLRWTRQIDLSDADVATDVISHDGSVYVLGNYADDDQDVFVYKYTDAGRPVWKRFIGTPEFDASADLAVDGRGNVYVAGTTEGALRGGNRGCGDFFVRKYTPGGTVLWTRQSGGPGCDEAFGVAARGTDELYVTGFYETSLGGLPSAGDFDAFLRRLDPADGSALWTDQ